VSQAHSRPAQRGRRLQFHPQPWRRRRRPPLKSPLWPKGSKVQQAQFGVQSAQTAMPQQAPQFQLTPQQPGQQTVKCAALQCSPGVCSSPECAVPVLWDYDALEGLRQVRRRDTDKGLVAEEIYAAVRSGKGSAPGDLPQRDFSGIGQARGRECVKSWCALQSAAEDHEWRVSAGGSQQSEVRRHH